MSTSESPGDTGSGLPIEPIGEILSPSLFEVRAAYHFALRDFDRDVHHKWISWFRAFRSVLAPGSLDTEDDGKGAVALCALGVVAANRLCPFQGTRVSCAQITHWMPEQKWALTAHVSVVRLPQDSQDTGSQCFFNPGRLLFDMCVVQDTRSTTRRFELNRAAEPGCR